MRQLTAFVHSRTFEVLMALAMIAATICAFRYGSIEPFEGDRGTLFISPNLWFDNRTFSLIVNLFAVMAIAMSCNEINKEYNIMRAQTALWATLFIAMQGALPSLAAQFYGGSLLCLVIIGATMLLYDSYGAPDLTRRVFFIFCLVTVTALFQYAALFYLPVMVVGVVQMRLLTMRSIVAAMLGVISPLIFLFGCGIVTVNDIKLPEYPGIMSVLTLSEMALTFATIGLTILLGITAMSVNLIKTLTYTAKFRAMNGFMNVLMFVTFLLLIVDYPNMSTYFSLVFFTIAYQTAHAFSNYRSPRSFILVFSILAVYAGIYAMSYWVE